MCSLKHPYVGSEHLILSLLNNDKDIADALGLKNTWAAKDYVSGKRNYSARKTMDIISKIREIDAKSKGLDNPNTSIGELMKELIFFILH